MIVQTLPRVVTTVARGIKGEIGPQRQALSVLVDSTNAPTARIALAEVHMDGGGQSIAHSHLNTPNLVWVSKGDGTTHHHEAMRALPHDATSFVYIPEGVPHAASNRQPVWELQGLEARLIEPGGRFNDDVVLRPELQPALTRAPRYPAVDEPAFLGDDGPYDVGLTDTLPGQAGIVPIVDTITVPGCRLSGGRMRLMPMVGPDGDRELADEEGAGTQPARRHPHSQRIVVVISGHLALVHGRPDEPAVERLGTNGVAWIAEDEPYVLANIGNDAVVGVVFSTDGSFDHDTVMAEELDEPAAAIIADIWENVPAPTELWAG